MKITQIETASFKVPYKPFSEWGLTGVPGAAEHILVRVRTDEGITGVAEATPRPTVYGESLASIQYAIHTWFAPLLIGLNPAHSEKIWGKLETIQWNPSAKGAIDLAVYDAAAQSRNLPQGSFAPRTHSPPGWNHRASPEAGERGLDRRKQVKKVSDELRGECSGGPGLDEGPGAPLKVLSFQSKN